MMRLFCFSCLLRIPGLVASRFPVSAWIGYRTEELRRWKIMQLQGYKEGYFHGVDKSVIGQC